jgi:hypothetical protein
MNYSEKVIKSDDVTSIMTLGEWERPLRITGTAEETIDNLKTKQEYIPYPEYIEMQNLLEYISKPIYFETNTVFLGQSIKISLTLDMMGKKIKMTNLKLWKIVDGQELRIAFAVLIDPRFSEKCLSLISHCLFTDRTPIIYPLFDTQYKNGEYEVNTGCDLTTNDNFINIFGLAMSIYQKASVK